ncbi:aldo/keto reductase, partial [Rhizobium ruizarguesonis]
MPAGIIRAADVTHLALSDQGVERFHLIRECEASLKRLKTDVIELYQVHEWDGQTPL